MTQPNHAFADPVLDDLSRRFAAHAVIYRGTSPTNASPLYAALSEEIAGDADVLDLVRDADRATQVSNLLFGAVHYLLLSDEQHSLATFYADLTPTPQPVDAAYPMFRAFCLDHADTIRHLVTTRRVQTNEVQRCTGLLLAFSLIAQQHPSTPLSLIEVGASAGLNLLWDRFGYTYNPLGAVGDAQSLIQLRCDITGNQLPSLPAVLPSVATRVGIDLHPIDVFDTETTRWVRALIWPEHRDRAQHLDQALALARRDPPHVVAGNAADLLLDLLATLPPDTLACVYHSYTLNQCSPAVREQIVDHCKAFGSTRPLVRVSLEWYGDQAQPQLEIFRYNGARESQSLLAYCESHGRALEWLA